MLKKVDIFNINKCFYDSPFMQSVSMTLLLFIFDTDSK